MTAIDTNVLIALWGPYEAQSLPASVALDKAAASGALIISAPVYAELLAAPKRTEAELDEFLADAEIQVDWFASERVWRMAGMAFQAIAARRRSGDESGPRRILADCLIGAHALVNGHSLLTFDHGFYERNFPSLTVKGLSVS